MLSYAFMIMLIIFISKKMIGELCFFICPKLFNYSITPAIR